MVRLKKNINKLIKLPRCQSVSERKFNILCNILFRVLPLYSYWLNTRKFPY